jgi:hypothetical protein
VSDSIDIINAFALLTNFVLLPALSYGFTIGTRSFGGDFSLFNIEVFQFCPGR